MQSWTLHWLDDVSNFKEPSHPPAHVPKYFGGRQPMRTEQWKNTSYRNDADFEYSTND